MNIFKQDLILEQYYEGVLILINKPLEWSSFDVVKKVKYLLQRKFKVKKLKVGHGGTLDPLADGLMIIGVGKATKVLHQIQGEDKEYIARITLGATTPSYDLETEIENKKDISYIDTALIKNQLESFLGETEQIPPLFSAKRINGERAYELARKGSDKKLEPVTVSFHELELLDDKLPEIRVRIRCSKGTYIRSFAHDLGQKLGCGAYLSGLKRTKSGSYKLTDAVSISELEEIVNKNNHLKTSLQ